MKKVLFLLLSILCLCAISCDTQECSNLVVCTFVYKYKNPKYKNLCQIRTGGGRQYFPRDVDTAVQKAPEYFNTKGRGGDYNIEVLVSNNGYIIEPGYYVYSCSKSFNKHKVGLGTENLLSTLNTKISFITKKDFIEKNLPYDTLEKTIIDTQPLLEAYYTNEISVSPHEILEHLNNGGDIKDIDLVKLYLYE